MIFGFTAMLLVLAVAVDVLEGVEPQINDWLRKLAEDGAPQGWGTFNQSMKEE
jgi:hypothetical protein